MIGVHFDDSADPFTGGVLPYEDSRHAHSHGLMDSNLSAIYNSADLDKDLPVGTEVDMNPTLGVLRMPALKAFLGQ